MMMRASLLLIALVSVAFAEAAEFEYLEREPVAHKYYRRRGKMRYDFGPERLGYVTLNGEDILGSAAMPVPVTNLFLKGRILYEEGELVFHQAKCPEKKLHELKFECSNGRVLEFWDDAFRITENKFIARALGDAELEALGYPKIPKTMRPRKQKQPIFTGDILGDWREEIVIASPDDKSIFVYSSPHPTEYRFHTFMLDPVYRLSVACWPICYNQSPQAGFYFGPDLKGHGIIFRGMKLE